LTTEQSVGSRAADNAEKTFGLGEAETTDNPPMNRYREWIQVRVKKGEEHWIDVFENWGISGKQNGHGSFTIYLVSPFGYETKTEFSSCLTALEGLENARNEYKEENKRATAEGRVG